MDQGAGTNLCRCDCHITYDDKSHIKTPCYCECIQKNKLNGWIRINEKFPDNDKYNQILITDGRDCYVAVSWWNIGLKIDWQYSYCCGCAADNITHWRPVPELPK